MVRVFLEIAAYTREERNDPVRFKQAWTQLVKVSKQLTELTCH